MTVRREIAENAFLVKRISYLACVNTDSLIPSRASRFTSDDERGSGSVIAAEVFMDNAGYDRAATLTERMSLLDLIVSSTAFGKTASEPMMSSAFPPRFSSAHCILTMLI